MLNAAAFPDGLQTVVVLRPVRLQVAGEVEQGGTQPSLLHEHQIDQQSTDAPVAVKKGWMVSIG